MNNMNIVEILNMMDNKVLEAKLKIYTVSK